jgi:predicted nucleic acid binding AN1-type Zn finger protein
MMKNYNSDIELQGSGNSDRGHKEADKIFRKRELEKLVKNAELNNKERKKRTPGGNLYIPIFTYELKDFIKDYCEKNNKELPKNFPHMKKNQLYAIYFNLRG